MRYCIDPSYRFCGWDGLPFAITSDEFNRPLFMNRERFSLLWSCNGATEVDRETLDAGLAEFFDGAIEHGVVREVPDDSVLQMHKYVRYPCRYRKDVQLSITGKCNYRCKHCLQSAPHGELGQPTTEQVCAEIDQLAECGVRNVSLTGGEPLIHEGFWDIIDHIKERGLRLTTIYSNGRLVDRELIDGLTRRDLRPGWQISFDGLGVHDWIRGVEGAEEAAINAIKLLVANGFHVGVAYTLTKRTAPALRETVGFLASIGVGSIRGGCALEQGEWLDQPEEWLTDEEYLGFYREYIPQYLADGRPLDLQLEGVFAGVSDKTLSMTEAERTAVRDVEDYGAAKVAKGAPGAATSADWGGAKTPYEFMADADLTDEQCSHLLSCGVLGTSFYIGPTGRVLPCMGMDATPVAEEFDTLWEKPLREILSDDSRFIEATGYTMKDVFDHNPECAECEARSHCGSGCRANAVGSGSDYLGLDKRSCMQCKEDWAGKIREAMAAAGVE